MVNQINFIRKPSRSLEKKLDIYNKNISRYEKKKNAIKYFKKNPHAKKG